MEINIKERKDEVIVKVVGSLETGSSNQLEIAINKLIKQTKSIILDFAQLDYVSSAGLRILLTSQRNCDAHGVKLRVTNVNDVVKEVFELTGFNTVLHIG